MKIPSKVIIAGITWEVETCGTLYNPITTHPSYAIVSFSETKIQIATKSGWVMDSKDVSSPLQPNLQIAMLFHELWHIYCDMAKVEDLNTEQNANLFGYISFNRAIEDQNNIVLALSGALAVMIERGIKVSAINKSVLEYYIYSTTMEY